MEEEEELTPDELELLIGAVMNLTGPVGRSLRKKFDNCDRIIIEKKNA